MLEALHERYDVHVTCHEVALAAVAASAGADLAAGSGGGGSTTSSSPMPPVAFGFWTATVRNRSKSSSSGSAAIQPQQSDPAAAGQPLFELSSLEVYGFDAWGRLSDVLMYRTPLDAEMAALVKAPGA